MKLKNIGLFIGIGSILLLLVFSAINYTDKLADAAVNEKKIDNVDALPQIACTGVDIPWLYIDGAALRKLTDDQYKNNPLYLSTTIKSCTVQAAGWFMKKKDKDFQDFDDGPQLKALPVGGGCGTTLPLPEGTYMSDFSIEKKLLKDFLGDRYGWIILLPEIYSKNNEMFIRWKVYGTDDDPRQACEVAFQWQDKFRNGPAAQPPANFVGNLSSPITLSRDFGFANPIPPYPAELE